MSDLRLYRRPTGHHMSQITLGKDLRQAEPVPAQTRRSQPTIWRKEKGHVSVPLFRSLSGRNKWNEPTTYSKGEARRLGFTEGKPRQTEDACAKQQHT